jgi:hypothetical protein
MKLSARPKSAGRGMWAGGYLEIVALPSLLSSETASLMNDLFGLAIPPEPPEGCGFLLVPAPVSLEELMADEEARNAGALEPGTFVNIKAEEFSKAARGEPSPLGEALLAFHRKYSALGS